MCDGERGQVRGVREKREKRVVVGEREAFSKLSEYSPYKAQWACVYLHLQCSFNVYRR